MSRRLQDLRRAAEFLVWAVRGGWRAGAEREGYQRGIVINSNKTQGMPVVVGG